MQFTITAVAALLSIVAASPVQLTPAYPVAKFARRNETTACVVKTGNAPQVSPDTVAAFVGDSDFSAAATAAGASPPANFDVVDGWIDLDGSASAPGYLTYIQSQLTSYDADFCADYCAGISGCASFVIYYERDAQLVNPNTGTPDDSLGCPGTATSSSITNIKCAFYSAFLDASQATNTGQYQDEFQVAIAGSTAFNFMAPTFDKYDPPTYLGDASLNIPLDIVANGYITVDAFADVYTPSSCIARCNFLVGQDGSPCTSIDAYFWYTNGGDPVFTCAYYSQNWSSAYATNVGQYNAEGDHFTIGDSYVYYASGTGSPK